MMKTMKISLSNGGFAVVDADNFSILKKYKWNKTKKGYARRTTLVKENGEFKWKTIYMHSFINKTPEGMVTDHINQNRLDNRRSNLRSVPYAENLKNKSVKVEKYLTKLKSGHYWLNIEGVQFKSKNLDYIKKKKRQILLKKCFA